MTRATTAAYPGANPSSAMPRPDTNTESGNSQRRAI